MNKKQNHYIFGTIDFKAEHYFDENGTINVLKHMKRFMIKRATR